MNIHHSNTLRNSFILEEEEDEDRIIGQEEKVTSSALRSPVADEVMNEFEKKFELPFPELLFINLADNQV